MYKLKIALTQNLELIFWVSALICLAVSNPAAKPHFDLCPFKLLGISWCPGCGIGHAISYLFHGHPQASFKAHWLGIPAVVIIFSRIRDLFLKFFVTFR